MITLEEIEKLTFSSVIERGTEKDFTAAYNYMLLAGWKPSPGSYCKTVSPFPDGSGRYLESYSILMDNPKAWDMLNEYLEQQTPAPKQRADS